MSWIVIGLSVCHIIDAMGDMLAVRRVNSDIDQTHQLVNDLRKQLMDQNYDYQVKSHENQFKTTSVKFETEGDIEHDKELAAISIKFKREDDAGDDRAFQTTSVNYKKENDTDNDTIETKFTEASTSTLSEQSTPQEKRTYQDRFKVVHNYDTHPIDEIDTAVKDDDKVEAYARIGNDEEEGIHNKHRRKHYARRQNANGEVTFKYLNVQEFGARRDGRANQYVIVTSKDGLLPPIKLPKSMKQYMQSDSDRSE